MRRLVASVAVVMCSQAALAWGPLGHRMVAETAALLVADDLPATWGPLVARHRFELGVYAFFPDALFRHVDGANGAVEGPTHYLYLDAASAGVKDAGSVDRRIVQFLDLARGELGAVKAPQGGYQPGASSEGDARRVYRGLYDLGVLSHYSGDVAMPYHATADTNGYARGEGGIHFYFENDCVNAGEPGLAEDVLKTARKKRRSWLASWRVAETPPSSWIAALLSDSLAAVATVSTLDRRYAITELGAAGSKANATRKAPELGCRPMRPVLVERLAKGAVLTAALWESVLPSGVDFSGASGLQFSDMHTAPEYVPPR